MKNYKAEQQLFGRTITLCVTDTDDGISVVLAGGERAHIGSVSLAGPMGEVTTTCFPGHKESLLSEPWAKRIWQEQRVPVVVSVGIHYDDASRQMIDTIVQTANDMLCQWCELWKRK